MGSSLFFTSFIKVNKNSSVQSFAPQGRGCSLFSVRQHIDELYVDTRNLAHDQLDDSLQVHPLGPEARPISSCCWVLTLILEALMYGIDFLGRFTCRCLASGLMVWRTLLAAGSICQLQGTRRQSIWPYWHGKCSRIAPTCIDILRQQFRVAVREFLNAGFGTRRRSP